jgi:polysaccharide deacetylase family protein (PEP-CTERM system associated)
MPITNALSIDVEDYFQVSAFEKVIDRDSWERLDHRVERNMDTIFALLSEKGVKATFFTLGWIAERYPAIVDKIVREGHELASHGYGHQRVWDLTPRQFRADVIRTKALLEDMSGVAVEGYRAPSYSISRRNIWALEVLAETGHKYSSSIYPGNHDHYGFPGAPRFIFKDEKTGLIEVPITTFKLFSKLIPAAGGGFFRFYPYALSRQLIRRINEGLGESTVFYLHPWELDPDQPRQRNMDLKTSFRHYLNLGKTRGRLSKLLDDFAWGSINDVFINRDNIPMKSLEEVHWDGVRATNDQPETR